MDLFYINASTWKRLIILNSILLLYIYMQLIKIKIINKIWCKQIEDNKTLLPLESAGVGSSLRLLGLQLQLQLLILLFYSPHLPRLSHLLFYFWKVRWTLLEQTHPPLANFNCPVRFYFLFNICQTK